MRTRLSAALAVTLTSAFGQEPLRTDTAAPYERVEVVKLSDTTRTADDLYKSAKRWFVDAFRDAEEVIQLDDPATRTIVGKGNFRFKASIFYGSAVREGTMRFSVEIIAKAGRYRVRFYDFMHEGSRSVSSTGVAPARNLGLIYNDRAYCTHSYNEKNKPNYWPTKHEEKVCVEEVWPQIHSYEVLMLASIKEAMEKPAAATSGPASSDW